MLSTLRVASRRAARPAQFNLVAIRAASHWANVPQGPPVRSSLTAGAPLLYVLTLTSHRM